MTCQRDKDKGRRTTHPSKDHSSLATVFISQLFAQEGTLLIELYELCTSARGWLESCNGRQSTVNDGWSANNTSREAYTPTLSYLSVGSSECVSHHISPDTRPFSTQAWNGGR